MLEVLVGGAVGIVGVGFGALLSEALDDRRERKRGRFALRQLEHEVRDVLVSIEFARERRTQADFDALPNQIALLAGLFPLIADVVDDDELQVLNSAVGHYNHVRHFEVTRVEHLPDDRLLWAADALLYAKIELSNGWLYRLRNRRRMETARENLAASMVSGMDPES